jgi:hypothetical protein
MTLVLSGTSGVALDSIKNSLMFLETAKATNSGTSIDFTGIPSWAKKITVMFNGVSTNGTSNIICQAGTSSGIVSTSYLGGLTTAGGTNGALGVNITTGFGAIFHDSAANINHGITTILNITGNSWVSNSTNYRSNSNYGSFGSSLITLSETLNRLRLTTVNGTDTFDAGSVNILIEGYV